MRGKYPSPAPGEWVRPVMKGYRMACCDCGLVHKIDFKVIPWGRGHKTLFRCWRDPRATGAKRSWRKRSGE